ncbi:hypothetical protein E5720_18045 [Rhodococcus sp. PAMC28707]|nr:hypothetical protein E5769_17480 [Rhodococcus sp. PAMC28705]QCB60097.1 hypothetical protein E5720_18045 [Rhodococcus sp. PAMC28707]
MFGDDLIHGRVDDDESAVALHEPDSDADQPSGHRISSEGEPHAQEAVDLAGDRWLTDLQP